MLLSASVLSSLEEYAGLMICENVNVLYFTIHQHEEVVIWLGAKLL